jgi:hypothetical protein
MLPEDLMPQDADATRLAGAAAPGGSGAPGGRPEAATPVPPRPGPPVPTAPRATAPVADAALELVEGLDVLPVAEHVARFEAVHDALRARLESRPGTGGGA